MLRRLVSTAAALLVAAHAAVAQAPVQGTVATSSTFTPITGIGAGGYIGSAMITGPSLFGTGPFAIFCTDQANNLSLGGTLVNAWITPLFGNLDLSKTRLGGDADAGTGGLQPLDTKALAVYRANAFLAAQLPSASATLRATLQDQMWQNAASPFNVDPAFGDKTFSALGWYVITMPNAIGNVTTGPQELLAFRPVPEPSTYALMATGLGLVALVVRRRRVA